MSGVIVTGAASGIGRACAEALAAEGRRPVTSAATGELTEADREAFEALAKDAVKKAEGLKQAA